MMMITDCVVVSASSARGLIQPSPSLAIHPASQVGAFKTLITINWGQFCGDQSSKLTGTVGSSVGSGVGAVHSSPTHWHNTWNHLNYYLMQDIWSWYDIRKSNLNFQSWAISFISCALITRNVCPWQCAEQNLYYSSLECKELLSELISFYSVVGTVLPLAMFAAKEKGSDKGKNSLLLLNLQCIHIFWLKLPVVIFHQHTVVQIICFIVWRPDCRKIRNLKIYIFDQVYHHKFHHRIYHDDQQQEEQEDLNWSWFIWVCPVPFSLSGWFNHISNDKVMRIWIF